MPIANRELPMGTILAATYKGEPYRCRVFISDEGKRSYRFEDGPLADQSFPSPSAAGSAVMGGTACNGWRFWSVEGEEPAPTAKADKPEKAARTKKAAPAPKKLVRLIKRTPNQQGVADGSTKWFCSACMKSFVAEGASEPDCCPEGHCKEVEDEFATAE